MRNSNSNFQSFKNEVLSKKVGRKAVSLSSIRLISDCAVEINGLALALSPHGFTAILKIVGISKTMRTNMSKQFGTSFTDNLISTMSKAMGATKGDVILLIDQRKRKVLNIVTKAESMVESERYLSNVDRVINDSKLEVESMVVRENGGFTISTIGDNTEWGLQGVESTESFKFGLNFDNDPIKGTRLMPFNQRLICTNGMIGQGFVGVHQLTNDTKSWDDFYHKIDVLKKDNFKPIEFSGTLQSIMKSDASLSEVMAARNMMKANSKVSDLELEQFAPIGATEEAYKKSGIIIADLNKEQRKNARTDLPIWDLINGVTDFASHNYGHQISSPDNLQRFAGGLFVKNPDLSNLVVDPFAV